MKTSHAFQGCAKIVFWLHTARTENPDTPQTHPSASDFHEYHSDTPRHPPHIPQTSRTHTSREHNMQTENSRGQSTPPDLLKQHLSVSWGVWRCLAVSVGICWHLLACCVNWRCLGGVCGIPDHKQNILDVFQDQFLDLGHRQHTTCKTKHS